MHQSKSEHQNWESKTRNVGTLPLCNLPLHEGKTRMKS